jgi:hypothetical protein
MPPLARAASCRRTRCSLAPRLAACEQKSRRTQRRRAWSSRAMTFCACPDDRAHAGAASTAIRAIAPAGFSVDAWLEHRWHRAREGEERQFTVVSVRELTTARASPEAGARRTPAGSRRGVEPRIMPARAPERRIADHDRIEGRSHANRRRGRPLLQLLELTARTRTSRRLRGRRAGGGGVPVPCQPPPSAAGSARGRPAAGKQASGQEGVLAY